MQVRYDEGVANRIGPEPCVGIREDVGEASVGEHTGQPLSHVNFIIPGADAVREAEGNMGGGVIASARLIRRGRRTWLVCTEVAPICRSLTPVPCSRSRKRTSLTPG